MRRDGVSKLDEGERGVTVKCVLVWVVLQFNKHVPSAQAPEKKDHIIARVVMVKVKNKQIKGSQ